MTNEPNLFDEVDNLPEVEVPDQTDDRDYASELIGDGKKYSDIKKAAKALLDKDNFIERLKTENAEMRASLKGEAKMDEFLERISKLNQTPSNAAPSGNQPADPPAGTETLKGLSLEDVEKLLSNRESAAIERKNLEQSKATAMKAFGANYAAELKVRATELGTTPEFLNSIAKQNPSAFARLIGAEVAPTAPSVPRTSVNSGANRDNKGDVRNEKYYSDLRRKMGDAEFFRPKVQTQLHQDMLSQGKSFFD